MKRYFLYTYLFAASMLLSSTSLFSNHSEEEFVVDELVGNSMFLTDLVTEDTFYVQTANCGGTGEVCIDFLMADTANYTFADNGMMYNGGFSGCMDEVTSTYDYAQLFGQGNLGPYQLNNWEVDGNVFSGVFSTIEDLTDSMNLWNPAGSWTLDLTAKTIVGGNSNSTYTEMDVTVISINAPSSIPLSSSAEAMGTTLNLSVGSHWVTITDNGGSGICLDSFYVEVWCVQPAFETLTLAEDSIHQFCFDHSELMMQPSTTEIFCPSPNGTPADFNLIAGNSCVQITAMTIGQDTACYVFCNDLGICDTTTIYVNVIERPSTIQLAWITDTIYFNTNKELCIDTSEFINNVVSIQNDCPNQSGEFVAFTLDTATYCVNMEAIDIGKDTACIFVTDDAGNIDTTYLVTYVLNPTVDTLFQSLTLGEMGMYCLDTTQLGGNIEMVENICGSTVLDVVAYSFNPATYCYDVLTNGTGQDTACIVICDNFGACDTSIFITTVTEPMVTNLVAMNDNAIVTSGEELTLDICANDSIPNNFLTNSYILTADFGGIDPVYGTVSFDTDVECNIIYIPNETDCDVQDQFNYVICNAEGCDTALVTIDVECVNISEPLTFASGFSPNGDEVNQYFVIKGAESYPGNTLSVFNRWGNQVYKTENYQNDWAGTWNGSNLQNGTYFYVFNDAAGNTYSGYVYIQK